MVNKFTKGKVDVSVAEDLADLTFNLLVNCQEKERRLAKQYGLTTTEFRCLRYFSANEVKSKKDIAATMMLSPSRLTRILDGLTEKGFAYREINPKDRRNMIVLLTEQGNKLVSELNEAYLKIHEEILTGIDVKEHKPLVSGMGHLLRALEEWIVKT